MKEDIKNKILKVLNSKSDLSATALAKEVGFSKASSIVDELQALVADGSVIEDKGGRFPVYRKPQKGEVAKPQAQTPAPQAAVKKEEEKVSLVDLAPPKAEDTLPAPPDHKMQGFMISNIKFEGKAMKKITTPDGKNIRVEEDEKLLVINSEPKFVVKTPEDVLTAIKKYSQDKGYTVFTVNDICQNKKISTENDIVKDQHIIMLSIQKHNKAA